MDESRLRRDLLELLMGKSAHASVEEAFAGVPARVRGTRPPEGGHSLFELLEHMRIAQEDILRYTLDARWRSPKWPTGYWPRSAKPGPGQWVASLAAFSRDLGAVRALVRDRRRDLTAPIPHGEGRTYLREVLLVADHNAYHLGQVVSTRRALGVWK